MPSWHTSVPPLSLPATAILGMRTVPLCLLLAVGLVTINRCPIEHPSLPEALPSLLDTLATMTSYLD
jgi:hypothetical protein